MAYRWFLGYDAFDSIPNYSTWSQNYIRRYKDSNIFNEIFDEILSQAIKRKFVDPETVFGDGTHQKANANKKKNHKETVELVSKYYEEDLLKEINEDRECIGKEKVESLAKTETVFDEETGEAKEVTKSKEITVSDTDPECGLFHKGEKQKCFAYSHLTFCDKKGFVLTVKTVPGNEHDSVAFYEAYKELNDKFPGKIKNVSLDAGFKTAPICRTIIKNEQKFFAPYTRTKGKKGNLKNMNSSTMRHMIFIFARTIKHYLIQPRRKKDIEIISPKPKIAKDARSKNNAQKASIRQSADICGKNTLRWWMI